MFIRFVGLILLGTLAVACGTSSHDDAGAAPDNGSDPDATPAGPDAGVEAAAGFVTAEHALPPPVTLHTTKVFAAPQLVTITYDGFALRDQVEAFGDFIVTSQWLDTVGHEYGVGHGTHVKKARFAEPAPAQITDVQIVALLKAKIASGDLPTPSATNAELVFLVYVPGSTKVDDGTGSIMCQDDYAGYHADSSVNGVTFGYAVVPDCDADIASVTNTASHEIIEAATDTGDAWYLDVPNDSLWVGMQTAEVADLCEWADDVHEGGFALQRSWSNAAAAAGKNPCVPLQPNGNVIMMGVTPAPAQAVKLKRGESTTFTLTGWSTAPAPDWGIFTVLTDNTDFDPEASLSAKTINNGTTVTVTLTVPATDVYGDPVTKGQIGSVLIYSGEDADMFTPVALIAN